MWKMGALCAIAATLIFATTAQAEATGGLSVGVARDAAYAFASSVCRGLDGTCARGYSARRCHRIDRDEVTCQLNMRGRDGVLCTSRVIVYGSDRNPRVDYVEDSARCFRPGRKKGRSKRRSLSYKEARHAVSVHADEMCTDLSHEITDGSRCTKHWVHPCRRLTPRSFRCTINLKIEDAYTTIRCTSEGVVVLRRGAPAVRDVRNRNSPYCWRP